MSEEVVWGENIGSAKVSEYNKLEIDELKSSPGSERFNQDVFGNIPVEVTVVLGKTKVDLQKLLQLSKGDVMEVNKNIGEFVDILVNNQVIAQGEVVAVGENYGVKVTKVLTTR
jgi:flagellar motor switch protein FliN/FliY